MFSNLVILLVAIQIKGYNNASPSTLAAANQKISPLFISYAPLMPLNPRPETPTSPDLQNNINTFLRSESNQRSGAQTTTPKKPVETQYIPENHLKNRVQTSPPRIENNPGLKGESKQITETQPHFSHKSVEHPELPTHKYNSLEVTTPKFDNKKHILEENSKQIFVTDPTFLYKSDEYPELLPVNKFKNGLEYTTPKIQSKKTHSLPTFKPTESPGNLENSIALDTNLHNLTEVLYNKEMSYLNKIQINLQGRTRSIDNKDEAPENLLVVDENVFQFPIIYKMKKLLNNYESDISINEFVTPNERKEENEFLDDIINTPVMRHAMLFLKNEGFVSADPKTHRDLLKEIWFTQYSRGRGKIGSSGFEHVFVHEVKNGTLIGLHNWVYFYEQERTANIDYKGYIGQRNIGTKAKILKMRFTYQGLNKPVNTLFIGTSPELEMALYTVCFKLRPDNICSVSLGGDVFNIITHSWRYRGKNLIGSAYPEI